MGYIVEYLHRRVKCDIIPSMKLIQVVDPNVVGMEVAAFVNTNYTEGSYQGFAAFYTQQINSYAGDPRVGGQIVDPATLEPIGLAWIDSSEVQGLLVQAFQYHGVPAGQDFKALILGNKGPGTFENGSYTDYGCVDGVPGKLVLTTGPQLGTGKTTTVVAWPVAA